MKIPNSISIDRIPIESIKPSPNPCRIRSRQQLRKLRRLLQKFGQVRPLIINPGRELIDGHGVLEALCELGAAFVDVVIVADQSPAAQRALALALNRSGEETRWNKGALRTEFTFLLDVGFELEDTGFDASEIEFIFEPDMPRGNVIETSAIPSVPKRPISCVEDIYQLGPHRVGCGSALDPNFLNRVRGPLVAECGLADFAHGLRPLPEAGKARHTRAKSDMSSTEIFAFFEGALQVLRASCSPRALIYVFVDWRHSLELGAAARAINLPTLDLCVWKKTKAAAGILYRSQHQLVFVLKAGDQPHVVNAEFRRYGRQRSNLWSYADFGTSGARREEVLASHISAKPTTLLTDIMRDVTNRGNVVIDTFLGSGSTLISAEEVGRVCIGLDRDPGCVDVAIRRWQKFTGLDAVHVASGETFNARTQRMLSAPMANSDER